MSTHGNVGEDKCKKCEKFNKLNVSLLRPLYVDITHTTFTLILMHIHIYIQYISGRENEM